MRRSGRYTGGSALLGLALATALLAPAGAHAQRADGPRQAAEGAFPSDADLSLMLRYLVEDGETPGIVFGILEADGSTRVLRAGTGGAATRPLGVRSVFEIGSINKTFTGALLADMVARGEVALDDPISKYLPAGVGAPSRNGIEITLRHLATHTSGLPRLPGNHRPSDMANPYADYTVETMYAFLSGHELRRDPGAEGEYSNLGFGLLGHLLGQAAGTTYDELLRTRILEPLAMTMTGYALEGDVEEWSTSGHREDEVVPYWFGTEAIAGAGGLRSNMDDMLRYLRAQVGEPRTDLERAMRRAHAPLADVRENMAIGLGWQIATHPRGRMVMHGGGTGGYNTYIAFDPDRRVGFVMLTNTTQFQDDLGLDFLRRGPPLDLATVDVPRGTLAAYVGEYEVAPGRNMVVRLEDEGFLTLQVPGNVRFRMYADSDTSFYLKRAPWRIAFTRDDSGLRMAADLEGQQVSGLRVSEATRPPRVVAGNQRPDRDDAPAITPADIRRYEGLYRLVAGPRTLDARVFGQDGRLMVQPQGQPTSELLGVGEHEFVLATDRAIRVVFEVEDDRAVALILHQGGGRFRGERQPEQ